nr:uncharacterized protein K02A2.6-like [Onthophagus taurus]
MLSLIHTGHLGITKSLQKARNFIFWPGITKDIINFCNKCDICLKYSTSDIKELMINQFIERKPWYKVGIDIYELHSKCYLMLVDYFSKYPEIVDLNNDLTAENIIEKTKSIFARHGIPSYVVSDSGRQFTSENFKEFSKEWNFSHQIASPHHQQSNGFAERTIQTVKKMIKKTIDSDNDKNLALLAYRNTPVYDIYTPSQLLMSRYLRDSLPIQEKLLQPKLINKALIHNRIVTRQNNNKKYYDLSATKNRNSLKAGMLIKYQQKPNDIWHSGVIAKQINPRTYKIKKGDGREIVRNKTYIKIDKTDKTKPFERVCV